MEAVKHVKLHIGDTPGLGDTAKDIYGKSMSDEDVLELVKEHIRIHCDKETQGLSAFLLVLKNKKDINDVALRRYINKFDANDFARNLIVILNRSKLKKIDDSTLTLFKDKYLEILAEILEDGGALRPETKTWVSQIKVI